MLPAKMDDTERMVLRRRKQYLSEVVEVNRDFLLDLKSQEVINDETVSLIMLEKVNATRMLRLIEAILSLKPVDGFAKFCLVLSKNYKGLSKDLIADLRVERGEIQPTSELIDESGVMVHRKFGTSKRFSETDKKEMAEMMAVKLQISQEEWHLELAKVKDELDEVKAESRRREAAALRIYEMQRGFVRQREKQLLTHAHDMSTTQDVVRKCLADPTRDGGGVLDQLRVNLDQLFHQVALAINHREALYYEKEKSMRMLGVKNLRTPLDDVISRMTGKSVNAHMEVENKADVVGRLERQVERLEATVEKHVAAEQELKRQLGERDREISKLRHMVKI